MEISAKGVHPRALLDRQIRSTDEQQEETSYRGLVADHGGTVARSPAAWQSYSATRSPEPQTSTCKNVYTRPMRKRERKRALSQNLRARPTATTCTSAARPCSDQGTAREVNSSSTWLAHFATRQEREEYDLRTSSTRRKIEVGTRRPWRTEKPARSGLEKCGPYRGLLRRVSAWEGEGRGVGASCELGRATDVVAAELGGRSVGNGEGGRWSCGFG